MVQGMQGMNLPDIDKLKQNVVNNQTAATKSSELKETFFSQNTVDNNSVTEFTTSRNTAQAEVANANEQVTNANNALGQVETSINTHMTAIKGFQSQISDLEAQLASAESPSEAEGGAEGASNSAPKSDIDSIKQQIAQIKEQMDNEQKALDTAQQQKEITLQEAKTAQVSLDRANAKLTQLEGEVTKAETKAVESAKNLEQATQTNKTDEKNLEDSKVELTKAEQFLEQFESKIDREAADRLLDANEKVQQQYNEGLFRDHPEERGQWCSQGVRLSTQGAGLKDNDDFVQSAKDLGKLIEATGNFEEIDISDWTDEEIQDFLNDPGSKGVIGIWDASDKTDPTHGHAGISKGDGTNSSDIDRSNPNQRPSHLYFPKKQTESANDAPGQGGEQINGGNGNDDRSSYNEKTNPGPSGNYRQPYYSGDVYKQNSSFTYTREDGTTDSRTINGVNDSLKRGYGDREITGKVVKEGRTQGSKVTIHNNSIENIYNDGDINGDGKITYEEAKETYNKYKSLSEENPYNDQLRQRADGWDTVAGGLFKGKKTLHLKGENGLYTAIQQQGNSVRVSDHIRKTE